MLSFRDVDPTPAISCIAFYGVLCTLKLRERCQKNQLHWKLILQLKRDGVSKKEIVRRTGVSRNSVRKFLSKVSNPDVSFTNQELAYTAYNNEQLEADAKRLQNLFTYFNAKAGDLSKTGVTRQLLWHEYQ